MELDDSEDVITPGAQVGIALHSIREQLGLSQAQAATEAGWDVSSWARLERGASANPTLGTLLVAANAVGVPVSHLLTGIRIGTGTGRKRTYTARQFVRDRQS
jgi:transcriptional regulator with XRE-family HTH domain